jgi:hypothetical protein
VAVVPSEAWVPSPPTPCAYTSPWPDRPCPGAAPTPQVVSARRVKLRNVIWHGIRATSPHEQHPPGDPKSVAGVFDGEYDWHSAVHGHWALLSMARVTRQTALETKLRQRLTDAALRRERTRLAMNPAFEMPYGRAWLLLLLSELSRQSWAPPAVAPLRRDTELALLAWLRATPYPEGSKNPGSLGFLATHDSWLFAYLLFVLSRSPSTKTQNDLARLRRTILEPQRTKLAKVVHAATDFLFLPAIQAVIDRVDPASPRLIPVYPLAPSPVLACPPLNGTTAHSAGAAVVHLWPYAIQTRANKAAACSRYHTRMAEMFSRTDQWAQPFDLVSHWVPQFLWMAMWLEAGRP